MNEFFFFRFSSNLHDFNSVQIQKSLSETTNVFLLFLNDYCPYILDGVVIADSHGKSYRPFKPFVIFHTSKPLEREKKHTVVVSICFVYRAICLFLFFHHMPAAGYRTGS